MVTREVLTLRYFGDCSYRDIAQDRARTEYELEFRADLGDAMVEVSEARLRVARVAYGAALAWARLNMLTGQALEPPPGGPPVSVSQ